ncbi:MAG: hypothetical protein ACF8GE_05220 [Phycisphaerales bacterium JB043]
MSNQARQSEPPSAGLRPSESALWNRRVRVPGLPWRVNIVVLGLSLSLIAHLLVSVVLAMLRLQSPSVGGLAPSDIELAVISQVELDELLDALPTSTDTALPELAPTDPTTSDLPDPESLGEMLASGDPAVGLGGVGESLGSTGEGLSLGGTASGGTSFFGVEAAGSRFAYIVDVSGSMISEGRLEVLQEQLIASIGGLVEHGSFCVVFYSTDSIALGGETRWIPATNANKSSAALEIRGTSARGATIPLPAFEMIFSLDPRPDAIYFMTDGEFERPTRVINRIGAMNGTGRRRTPVHCIAFESQIAEDYMRRIAAMTGGTYTFVRGSASP